jgi:hydroxyacylglutathione hydrolase
MITVVQIPARKDNYAYLLREPRGGLVATIDTPEVAPLVRALEERGWKLDYIFNTHHHGDHVGGNRELINRYGCRVFGAAKDAARIPGIQERLDAGSEFLFGEERVKVFGCDGHTIGHIAYWFPESKAVFVGDTIFSLGCGALFEGTARQMWESLERLRALPDDTLVYCAHEYTLENGAYALAAEPGNAALRARMREAREQRAAGLPTVPSTMGSEKACNPFLRPDSAELQRRVGMTGRELWEVFGAVRADKDAFDAAN